MKCPFQNSHLMEPTNAAERKRLLDEAEASIEAGRGIPHDKVAAWLFELASGRAEGPVQPVTWSAEAVQDVNMTICPRRS
jgi:hypothetical protein